MGKIAFLKSSDNCVGRVLCSVLPPATIDNINNPNKFLIIRPGGIGDAVILAPVINSLKKDFPNCTITLLAENRNSSAFSLISGVDKTFRYDRPLELAKVLCDRYDIIIDTEQWYRLSAVVARLIWSQIKIGFATNERQRMFNHIISYDLVAYESENFASLLKPLGVNCQLDSESCALSVTPQSASKAVQLLQPINSESFVVMFPGASIPEKRWGIDRFRRVAELLAAFGITVVVVGGKDNRQHGEQIVGGGLGLNLAGVTSLPETAAIIQKSSLLLSGDSGVLHIGVGLGVPTVSLFGPGRASKWAPRGDRHLVINKCLPCSPCTTFGNTPPCPIHAQCMRDITVDEVFNAVTMLLTSVGATPSRCCKRDWGEII
jgi:ADP-heptose:LPS heptosyltransferase